MCEHYKYMLQIKPEFDNKFKTTGIRSQMIYLCEVEDVAKGNFKLNYDEKRFNLLVKECGKCHICRFKKASVKACQVQSEYKTCKKGAFITLTFGEKQMTDYIKNDKRFNNLSDYMKHKYIKSLQWTLEKREFQLFMKRLRWRVFQDDLLKFSMEKGYYDNYIKKNGELRNKVLKLDKYDYTDFKPHKLRFCHCGEYGEYKQRPHHHLILLGLNLPYHRSELRWSWKQNKNVIVHFNNLLSELWPFGDVTLGKVTYQSCNYVARYVTKKVINKNKDYVKTDIAGSVYRGRLPEYCTQSNRRGLGYEYYMQNAKKINSDLSLTFLNNKGEVKTVPLPRYFKELMRRHFKSDYLKMLNISNLKSSEFSSIPSNILLNRMYSDRLESKNREIKFKGNFDSQNISYEKLRYLEFELKKQVFDDLTTFKDRYLACYKDIDFFNTSEKWRVTCYKNFEKFRKHRKTMAINKYVQEKTKSPDAKNLTLKLYNKVSYLKAMQNPFKRENLDDYAKLLNYNDEKIRERWLNYESNYT